MLDITVDDLYAVYDRLKERYPIIMTNSKAEDERFTADFPLLVGHHHGQTLWLYEYGGDFVLDVMDEAETKGTHWHPMDVDSAAMDIAEFMEGRSDYELFPFPEQ